MHPLLDRQLKNAGIALNALPPEMATRDSKSKLSIMARRVESIPLCGRIVAVADVYDALRTKRVYKNGLSHDIAKSMIVQERGSHFDPDLVDAFGTAPIHACISLSRLNSSPAPATIAGNDRRASTRRGNL
jgi:hypothetical protein